MITRPRFFDNLRALVQKVAATKPAAPPKPPTPRQVDELSTGKGMALRTRAATALGSPQYLKAPTDASQVDQANADFDRIHDWGNAGSSMYLSAMQEHAGQKDYLAQLTKRANESGDLDIMMRNPVGPFSRNGAGAFNSLYTDEQRAALVGAVQAGLDEGTITAQQIRDHAAQIPAWAEVATQLKIAGAGINQASLDESQALDELKGNYDDAHDEVQQKEARMQKELANCGGAMTPEQQAKFADAFRKDPENIGAYQAEAAAAKALADHLSTNQAAVLDAATRDPAARQVLYDSLKVLSTSGQGEVALKLAVAIRQDPASPIGQAFSGFTGFDDEVMNPAMTAAGAQLLADNGGDAPGALAQIKQMLAPMKNAWEGAQGVAQVKGAWDDLDQVMLGHYDHLTKLGNDWATKSGPMKGLAGLGVLFGAAWASSDGSDGNYASAVQGIAQTGQAGLTLVAGATKSLADAGKLASYTADGLKFAAFAAKLAPGLGVLANATSLGLHAAQAFGDGFNPGYAGAVLGDAVGVLGSAIECLPGGQVPGALISGIGAAISALGDLIGGWFEAGELRDEASKFLEQAGIAEPLKTSLLEAGHDEIEQFKRLGLTPQQLQVLANDCPDLLKDVDSGGPTLDNLIAFQQRSGLSGQQIFDMLQAADVAFGSGYGAAVVLRVLGAAPGETTQIRDAQTTGELIAALEDRASKIGLEPDQVAAINAAAEQLRTPHVAHHDW